MAQKKSKCKIGSLFIENFSPSSCRLPSNGKQMFVCLLFAICERTYITKFSIWARDGAAAITLTDLGGGSWRVVHTGVNDFAVNGDNVAFAVGDELSIGVVANVNGGTVSTGTVPYDENGTALSWSAGVATTTEENIDVPLTVTYVVPARAKRVQMRLTGRGPMVFTFRDYWYEITGHLDIPTDPIVLSNSNVEITLDPVTQLMVVEDRVSGRTWSQTDTNMDGAVIAKRGHTSSHVELVIRKSGVDFEISLDLNDDELNYSINADADVEVKPPLFPKMFVSKKGDRMLVPLSGGISVPSEQEEIVTTNGPITSLYQWQSQLSMSFVAITDGKASLMIVFDTPNDGVVQMVRSSTVQNFYFVTSFELEKGRFSYQRRLRFIFMSGNHVAVAKRYRRIAQSKGLIVPFTEKVKSNKYIDMLLGSVNVYVLGSWDVNRTTLYEEMQSLGIQRILSSQAVSQTYVEYMNNNMTDVLSSRYDIYQDTSNPYYEEKGWISWHSQWVREAYPNELITNATNDPITSWSVQNLSNPDQMIGCYVLCDLRAPNYAVKRLEDEYAQGYNYRSRFIDTTFASGYRECYHPDHPMTKTVSKEYRYKLLELFHKRGLVVGTEDGKDVAVPVADFFEGMMSPGSFRVPGSGRNLEEIFLEVPEAQVKVMLNESLRVPLFELVYHDCVVSYWYWCDHNAKVIPLWDRRDLFNRLYGTPPMFVFNQTVWKRYRDRFAQSYATAAPVSRLTGYAEMTDHVYLTSDCSVQQTLFSNGVRVTVNFGLQPYKTSSGNSIPAMGSLIEQGVFPENNSGLPPVAIAFIVIFVLVAIAGATVGVIFFLKRRVAHQARIQEQTLHV